MDIATTAAVATAAAATIKTPDPESETPTRIQPIKPLPFTNGVLKRHQPLLHHHHLNGPPVVITYKECLKNHAASLGGHAVDGCGEFMPSPTATHVDPTSLKCAACGCHRNFHRREPDDIHPAPNPAPAQHVIEYQPHHRHHPPPPPPSRGGGANSSSPNSPSPPPISSSYYPSAPHMLLALSAGLPQENNLPIPTTPGTGATPTTAANSNGRKRFRTKFTPDQKEKMHEFAEKVGWKMQKRDEEIITGFCNEIGVDKGVFKVWMHNNKSTFGKKSDTDNNGNHNGTSGGDRINNFGTNGIENNHHFNNNYHHHHDQEDTGNSHSNHHHQFLHNNGSVSTGNVVATNGSSSS